MKHCVRRANRLALMSTFQLVFILIATNLCPVKAQQPISDNPTINQQASNGLQQQTPSAIQAQLNAIQAQAQRQLNQLNGLVMNVVNNANNNSTNGSTQQNKYQNVLETLSSVGKAIQQQISAASNQVNVIAPSSASSPLGSIGDQSASIKKNEYQSIVVTDQGSALQSQNSAPQFLQQTQPAAINGSAVPPLVINYREQGEQLRQEIGRRVGQLQQVVANSMDLLKNNGDVIVRRLLEQMNARLDLAKAKADRIINEPATNEMAIKALSTINLGLNNLNNIISNIVNRLELATKDNNNIQQQLASSRTGQQQQPVVVVPLLDTNKLRFNLQQLGQQFHSALNNSQLHQQLFNRQRSPVQAINPSVEQQNKINLDFTGRQQQRN